jgi:hypothetical protein
MLWAEFWHAFFSVKTKERKAMSRFTLFCVWLGPSPAATLRSAWVPCGMPLNLESLELRDHLLLIRVSNRMQAPMVMALSAILNAGQWYPPR